MLFCCYNFDCCCDVLLECINFDIIDVVVYFLWEDLGGEVDVNNDISV